VGRDIFVLEKGGNDRILDFGDRQDQLGLIDGLRFSDLDIVQQGKNTVIFAGRKELAELRGISTDQITKGDFVVV
jgi:hypothetical protein